MVEAIFATFLQGFVTAIGLVAGIACLGGLPIRKV